jgi:hypothetical protein
MIKNSEMNEIQWKDVQSIEWSVKMSPMKIVRNPHVAIVFLRLR